MPSPVMRNRSPGAVVGVEVAPVVRVAVTRRDVAASTAAPDGSGTRRAGPARETSWERQAPGGYRRGTRSSRPGPAGAGRASSSAMRSTSGSSGAGAWPPSGSTPRNASVTPSSSPGSRKISSDVASPGAAVMIDSSTALVAVHVRHDPDHVRDLEQRDERVVDLGREQHPARPVERVGGRLVGDLRRERRRRRGGPSPGGRLASSVEYALVICAVRMVRIPASAASAAVSGWCSRTIRRYGGADIGPGRVGRRPRARHERWPHPPRHAGTTTHRPDRRRLSRSGRRTAMQQTADERGVLGSGSTGGNQLASTTDIADTDIAQRLAEVVGPSTSSPATRSATTTPTTRR